EKEEGEKTAPRKPRLSLMGALLADLLREKGEPAAALTEYEASMKSAPERLRGFYGAAKAAETSGDKEKRTRYFRELARLTRNGDGDRAEIREARLFGEAK